MQDGSIVSERAFFYMGDTRLVSVASRMIWRTSMKRNNLNLKYIEVSAMLAREPSPGQWGK